MNEKQEEMFELSAEVRERFENKLKKLDELRENNAKEKQKILESRGVAD